MSNEVSAYLLKRPRSLPEVCAARGGGPHAQDCDGCALKTFCARYAEAIEAGNQPALLRILDAARRIH
jgi:hypothetical protein